MAEKGEKSDCIGPVYYK